MSPLPKDVREVMEDFHKVQDARYETAARWIMAGLIVVALLTLAVGAAPWVAPYVH